MSVCEMCGNESPLVKTVIEGVELSVCKNCSGFGKIVRKRTFIPSKKKFFREEKEDEDIDVLKEDYPSIIREKREQMGLKQKEMAMFLAERESVIHKIEAGNYKPSIKLARKIEKYLNIKLIEKQHIEKQDLKVNKQILTIGDMIKIKK